MRYRFALHVTQTSIYTKFTKVCQPCKLLGRMIAMKVDIGVIYGSFIPVSQELPERLWIFAVLKNLLKTYTKFLFLEHLGNNWVFSLC
jgi:hypothetical protein